MEELLDKIAICVERGKIDIKSVYPPDLKGQIGTDELTKEAIEKGITAADILEKGLIVGMNNIGKKFKENKVFVPDVLMAAKAMKAGMSHLKPFFQSGEVKRKGAFIIGTVAGDLHDIGKNLVSMMIEGAGWEVIDLGIDVSSEKFIDAIDEKPGAVVGLSSLLTTTMTSMEQSVKDIRAKYPGIKILIGGAPVSQSFASQIGADGYSPDPQGAIDFLNGIA
jgi:methanogenic corrinoid protein MtbC1